MKVFWFDTETSGLDEKENGIISLAYIVEIDGDIKEEGMLLSNCEGKKLNKYALQVNGFTEEAIKTHPSPITMYDELNKVFDRYVDRFDKKDKFIAGGYNVDFDMRFLRQLWLECQNNYFGSWFGFGTIDPIHTLRFLEYSGKPFQAAGKLVDIARGYGIDTTDAHDAFADIRMTMAVVKAIQNELSYL